MGCLDQLTPTPEPATLAAYRAEPIVNGVYSRSFAAKNFFVSRRNSSN